MPEGPPASRRIWWLLFAGTVAANLVLLYWPRPVDGGGIPQVDKVAHAVAFAAVAWSGTRCGIPFRALGPLLVAHAVSSEIVQDRLLAQRSGDVWDVVADLAGVLAGWLLATRWRQASWRRERATS